MATEMWSHGAYYIWVWLVQTRLVYVLPFAAIGFVARPRTPRFVLGVALGLLAIVYVPYTISVGGDFMGLHRFIMPLFVVAALAVTLGWQRCASWFDVPWRRRVIAGALVVAVAGFAVVLDLPAYLRTVLVVVAIGMLPLVARELAERWRRVAAPALVAVAIAGFAATQIALTGDSLRWGNFAADRGIIDTPAFLIVYTDDRAAIGRAMESCFTDDDFSIVGGAGAQPYYGRMRGIDVVGLVSDTIAHDEPRRRARAGHTKFGADPTLAAYDPTFVFSCYAIHKTPAPPALNCNPAFWLAKGYELVTMRIPGMRQSGEYYTFLAKKSRAFSCPGRVR
jgi:hypothetical protein